MYKQNLFKYDLLWTGINLLERFSSIRCEAIFENKFRSGNRANRSVPTVTNRSEEIAVKKRFETNV